MEKSVAISLVIFLAAALTLQASSAPAVACKHHMDSSKPPAANDWEGTECEYRSLDKRALIDAVLNACSIIITSSSDIHHRLMGPEAKDLVCVNVQ